MIRGPRFVSKGHEEERNRTRRAPTVPCVRLALNPLSQVGALPEVPALPHGYRIPSRIAGPLCPCVGSSRTAHHKHGRGYRFRLNDSIVLPGTQGGNWQEFEANPGDMGVSPTWSFGTGVSDIASHPIVFHLSSYTGTQTHGRRPTRAKRSVRRKPDAFWHVRLSGTLMARHNQERSSCNGTNP